MFFCQEIYTYRENCIKNKFSLMRKACVCDACFQQLYARKQYRREKCLLGFSFKKIKLDIGKCIITISIVVVEIARKTGLKCGALAMCVYILYVWLLSSACLENFLIFALIKPRSIANYTYNKCL